MKTLFNTDGEPSFFNEEAKELVGEVEEELEHIYNKYISAGYPWREVLRVMSSAVISFDTQKQHEEGD